jgi:murein L,D-transpeptidase YcbB/YkuD
VGSRLHNLGYLDRGDWQVSPAAELTLRSAIEEFQCDEGLTVNGVADDATRARLVVRHGI